MATHRIQYTQDAVDDLDAIFHYIAVDNADAAMNLLNKIDSSISALAESPHIGAALPAGDHMLIESGYRHIVVHPYLIFYRVIQDEVFIGRVLHSRQDWLQLLFR